MMGRWLTLLTPLLTELTRERAKKPGKKGGVCDRQGLTCAQGGIVITSVQQPRAADRDGASTSPPLAGQRRRAPRSSTDRTCRKKKLY
ncbi:hypothetical protein Taro_023240 [Colocasia esculenta]|uniref:Secreted protein n=1 Tax=Colocasia esculenta TaxID=4460 RepID=A0A843V3Q1_COLES|nr:hypothetical protein [Colocasia esculenta]